MRQTTYWLRSPFGI